MIDPHFRRRAFSLLMLACVASQAATAAEPIDRAVLARKFRTAVVTITVTGRDRQGRPSTRRGTGVFVSERWIVSAKHVVGADSEWDETSPGKPDRQITVRSLDSSGRLSAPIIANARLSATDDVAALRVDVGGTACASLSNESVSSEPRTFLGLFWGSSTTEPDARTVDTMARTAEDGDVYLLGYRSVDGDSGSPILDAEGHVVAVLTGDGIRPGSALAIPAYRAASVLPPEERCTPPTDRAPDAPLAPWKRIGSEIVNALRSRVVAGGAASRPGVMTISGDLYWDDPVLLAERIVFEPGARLIFRTPEGAGREVMLVTGELRSLSNAKPGAITWEKPAQHAPRSVGAAASGRPGQGDGVPGENGRDGEAGYSGEHGASAPNVAVFTNSIVNPVVLDLGGQSGSPGSNGMAGGNGGPGSPGGRASASGFDCRHGPGNGGRGGEGGVGGTGGTGGGGGSGGQVTLISGTGADLLRNVIIPYAGGQGGPGGAGGLGGQGGPGGPRGAAAPPYCRDDAKDGDPGGNGAAGARGEVGSPGRDGSALFGELPASYILELSRK